MNKVIASVTIGNVENSLNWLVRIDDVVATTEGESVSIVVTVRRDAQTTLPQVQRSAVLRSIELLQTYLDNDPQS